MKVRLDEFTSFELLEKLGESTPERVVETAIEEPRREELKHEQGSADDKGLFPRSLDQPKGQAEDVSSPRSERQNVIGRLRSRSAAAVTRRWGLRSGDVVSHRLWISWGRDGSSVADPGLSSAGRSR